MNEGPTIRCIPAQEYKVCHGCKWLDTKPVKYGHKTVTKDYRCNNPDSNSPFYPTASGIGRMIDYNREGDCITPHWCPYLKEVTKKVTICAGCGRPYGECDCPAGTISYDIKEEGKQ